MSVDPMSYVVPFNPNENSASYWGAGPTTPSPADAARQRKNQQIDVKRKEGTQARQILQQNAGAPNGTPAAPKAAPAAKPQDYAPEAPPQYTPPAPYQPPQFTPAQYQPPAKGLEYLGLGLSLLFPGSPIAGMAGGMLHGLQQRADTNYQRNEQNAEQQYQVQADSAKAAYEGALEKSKADFQNAQIKYQAAQDLRARNINPATGQPFQYPDVRTLLPRTIDPKTKQPVVDSTYGGMAQGYRRLAIMAEQNGATDIAKQYDAQAADLDRQQIDDNNNAKALQVAYMATQRAYGVANLHEDREDARTQYRVTHAGAMTPREISAARDQALSASATWNNEWAKATNAPTKDGQPIWVEARDAQGNVQYQTDPNDSSQYLKDANGHAKPVMIQAQPAVGPGLKSQMVQIFKKIASNPDPFGAAEYYASQVDNPSAQGLIEGYGKTQDIMRRAQGYPVGQPFVPPPTPKRPPPPKEPASPIPGEPGAKGFGVGSPKFPNPPGLPTGALYIGPGSNGGDEYQFPDGSHQEYKP